jgi:hypothetical protein
MSDYDPDRDCCPDWAARHAHAVNCYYGPGTWQRVGTSLVHALSDWLEKKMLLDPTTAEPDPEPTAIDLSHRLRPDQ